MSRPDRLDRLELSPCSKRWSSLEPTGDGDRTRSCDECQLHVHNLTAYPRDEALELLEQSTDRLCVMKVVLPDGTLLTRPPRPSFLRRFLAGSARAATWLVLLFGGWLGACKREDPALEEPAVVTELDLGGIDAETFERMTVEQRAAWLEMLEKVNRTQSIDAGQLEMLQSLGYVGELGYVASE